MKNYINKIFNLFKLILYKYYEILIINIIFIILKQK